MKTTKKLFTLLAFAALTVFASCEKEAIKKNLPSGLYIDGVNIPFQRIEMEVDCFGEDAADLIFYNDVHEKVFEIQIAKSSIGRIIDLDRPDTRQEVGVWTYYLATPSEDFILWGGDDSDLKIADEGELLVKQGKNGEYSIQAYANVDGRDFSLNYKGVLKAPDNVLCVNGKETHIDQMIYEDMPSEYDGCTIRLYTDDMSAGPMGRLILTIIMAQSKMSEDYDLSQLDPGPLSEYYLCYCVTEYGSMDPTDDYSWDEKVYVHGGVATTLADTGKMTVYGNGQKIRIGARKGKTSFWVTYGK